MPTVIQCPMPYRTNFNKNTANILMIDEVYSQGEKTPNNITVLFLVCAIG